MDTKDDRLDWCDKLNESLANVRQWYADASQTCSNQKNGDINSSIFDVIVFNSQPLLRTF